VPGIERDPEITPVGVILHVTAVPGTRSLYDWFSGPSGGVESHWHVADDGYCEQYRPANHEADANYLGNSWIGSDGKRYGFLSVENSGGMHGRWTPDQVRVMKDLIRWAGAAYGFPLRVAPGYHSPGVGYHTMFGAGPGTQSWSNATGKTCPGPDRIAQFHTEFVPWLIAGAGEDDDMPYTEAQLGAIVTKAVQPLGTKLDRLITQGQRIKDIARQARQAAADAVDAGASPEEVGASVEQAVTRALAEGAVDVNVTVAGRGQV
jgi:hypothetical protein